MNSHGDSYSGWFHGSGKFEGTTYVDLAEGTFLHLITGGTYAVRLEDLDVNLRNHLDEIGWYRVGTDCAPGTYRLVYPHDTYGDGEYRVYPSARLPRDDEIVYDFSLSREDGPVDITVYEGQYLVLEDLEATLIE